MTVIVYVHGFIDIHTSVTDLVFKTTVAFTILKLKWSLPQSISTECKYANTVNLFCFHKLFYVLYIVMCFFF